MEPPNPMERPDEFRDLPLDPAFGAQALADRKIAALVTSIAHWRDTEINWINVDPIIPAGEWAFAMDITVAKFGNGVDTWSALPVVFDGRIDASNLAAAVAAAQAAAADSGDAATDSDSYARNAQVAASSASVDAQKARDWATAPRETVIDGESKSARAWALDARDTAAASVNLDVIPITEADLTGGAYTLKAGDFGKTLLLALLAGRKLVIPGGLALGADGWPWIGIINAGADVAVDKVAGVVMPAPKAPIVRKWGQDGTPSATPQVLNWDLTLPSLASGKFLIQAALVFSESDSAAHSCAFQLINPGPPETVGPAVTVSYASPFNDGTARCHMWESYVDGGTNFAGWTGKLRANVSARLTCIVIIITPIANCGAKVGTTGINSANNAGTSIALTSPAIVTPNAITVTSAFQRSRFGDPGAISAATLALTGNSSDTLSNPDQLYRILSYAMAFQVRTITDALAQTATWKASHPALGIMASTWQPAGAAASDPILSGSTTVLSGTQRSFVANPDGIHWYL